MKTLSCMLVISALFSLNAWAFDNEAQVAAKERVYEENQNARDEKAATNLDAAIERAIALNYANDPVRMQAQKEVNEVCPDHLYVQSSLTLSGLSIVVADPKERLSETVESLIVMEKLYCPTETESPSRKLFYSVRAYKENGRYTYIKLVRE